MIEQARRLENIDRLIEVSIGILLISGLVIINLPIIPVPDKNIIYVTAFLVTIFTFVWHRLRLPISLQNKNFLESIVYLIAISLVVHATGGARSYFNFLYLLATLNISTSSSGWRTITLWLVASGFIFGEAFLFEQPEIRLPQGFSIPPYSLAILNSWAVGLVTAYSRYLEKETETAQTVATTATVEKEKAVNKLKDEFLFIIVHELRGPITAIRGYLELFLSGDATKIGGEAKDLTNAAFRQSERLNDLIFELLDLSRLEVGKLKLQSENLDINKFVQELVQRDTGLAKERKIDLVFKPENKRTIVFADEERVREVIQNLLDNALKYTGEFGKVWVWIESKGSKAFISVADSGVGIRQEDLSSLFDRFHHRLADSDSETGEVRKEKSIGLGLFLAKNLVEKMDGEIFVESTLGKGSKFTFTLPLSKEK